MTWDDQLFKLAERAIQEYRRNCVSDAASESMQVDLDRLRAEAKASDGRRRLPDQRPAMTYHGRIGNGMDFYVTVGFYPDTYEPGEVFMRIARTGSIVSGMTNAACVGISVALQCGYPWSKLRKKYLGTQFEPRDPLGVGDYNRLEGGNVMLRPYTSVLDALAKSIDHLSREQKSLWGEEDKSGGM